MHKKIAKGGNQAIADSAIMICETLITILHEQNLLLIELVKEGK